MSLLLKTFEGLTERDFSVYESKCWSSNLHNLDRMKAKERVKALAVGLSEVLGDADGLTVDLSSEIPSVWNGRKVEDQWAYVLRSEAQRKTLQPVVARNLDLATRVKDPAEHHRNVLLALRLDSQGVEVSLRANEHATVDLANLIGRAEAEPEALSALLKALPDSVTLNGLRATYGLLVEAAKAARSGESDWLAVGHLFPKEEALALGTDLAGAVAEMVAILAPLYRFIAWTAENDHIGVSERLEAAAEKLAARQREEAEAKAEAKAARERRASVAEKRAEAKQAAADAWAKLTRKVRSPDTPEPPKAKPAAPKPAKPAQPAAKSAGESEAAPKAARPGRSKPRRDESKRPPRGHAPGKGAHRRGKPGDKKVEQAQAAAPKAAAPRQAAPAPVKLEVGLNCRLTRGLLAGKEGVIKSKDKKGYYRVSVGGLEVNVSAGDLEAV